MIQLNLPLTVQSTFCTSGLSIDHISHFHLYDGNAHIAVSHISVSINLWNFLDFKLHLRIIFPCVL